MVTITIRRTVLCPGDYIFFLSLPPMTFSSNKRKRLLLVEETKETISPCPCMHFTTAMESSVKFHNNIVEGNCGELLGWLEKRFASRHHDFLPLVYV